MCSKLFSVIAMVFLIGFPVNNSFPYSPGEIEWPIECKDKTYCHVQPTKYPWERIEELLQNTTLQFSQFSDLGNRSSSEDRGDDVAGCKSKVLFEPLYLIKDEHDRVRYVAQFKSYAFIVRTEECKNPGRVFRASHLRTNVLKEFRVDCVETRIDLKFEVLSLDGKRIETTSVKDGIPTSCTGKIMQSQYH